MAQSPLDILNAAGIDSLGRGQSGQQQPMQQAPQGGLPPIKPSSSQTKSILESEIERLTGEEDELGSLKQLADERKKEREKLQKFYNEFQPSDAEKFLAIGRGLGQRVPRGGGQSAIAASVMNAAEQVAPVVSKQEQLKQAYRLKAMEMGYAAADEAYNESMTQKRDIQKLLMQEQIRSKGADGMSNVGKAVRDFDPTLQPGTPDYQAVFNRFANFMYGNAAGKAIASNDPRVISLTTNPQYIQEKKAIEDQFDNASTRAAYGPNGAEQWQTDRQAKLDALQQRYLGMGAGASNLVPGAPRSEPSAPGIIPPPSPMNQAPSASNVVPGAEGQASKAEPVSVRNNNPLNLVDTKTGSIKTFGSPEEGATAGFNDLVSKLKGSSEAYKRRFGDAPITPERLAEVWSPALGKGNSAASTANYAKAIASAAGISTSDTINPTPETINKIYQAMATFEAGAPSTPAVAPSATVQAAAPKVAPALASAAKPGEKPFIAPAQEAAMIEESKALAKAKGEATANLPATKQVASTLMRTIKTLDEHPGKEAAVGPSGVFNPINYLPFTKAGGFRNLLEQFDSQAFLKSYQDLKGGGQITEVEGEKATKAFSRLKASTSEEEFQTALNELKGMIIDGARMGYEKAGKAVPPTLEADIEAASKPTPRSTGFTKKKAPVNKAVKSQFSIVNEQK